MWLDFPYCTSLCRLQKHCRPSPPAHRPSSDTYFSAAAAQFVQCLGDHSCAGGGKRCPYGQRSAQYVKFIPVDLADWPRCAQLFRANCSLPSILMFASVCAARLHACRSNQGRQTSAGAIERDKAGIGRAQQHIFQTSIAERQTFKVTSGCNPSSRARDSPSSVPLRTVVSGRTGGRRPVPCLRSNAVRSWHTARFRNSGECCCLFAAPRGTRGSARSSPDCSDSPAPRPARPAYASGAQLVCCSR